MAKVDRLSEAQRTRTNVHDAVEATYHVFVADGEAVLQIDTYGKNDRQIPGKISQSIQFGREGRMALRKLLDSLDD